MEKKTEAASGAEDRERVRLGVIGAGWFASRRHLPDAQADPHVALAALCRRDPTARARMADHFQISAEDAYADWRHMLDHAELDAVLIATPHSLHFEQAKAALERGLHVLIEKPMALRGEEARALVALAEAQNRKLSVALNPPFWAHCHRIRRALRSEKMGVLECVSLCWTGSAEFLFGRASLPDNLPGIVPPTLYRADPELNGGGFFIDGGSHLISELIWVTGLPIRRVACLMDTTPADMRIALSVEFDNGAVGTVTAIGNSAFPNRRVRNVFGASNGRVLVNGADFETVINVLGQEPQKFREADLLPVANPVGNFVDAIQGRSELFSPPEHGAHVVEVMEAAYESASTGRLVSLSSPQAPTPLQAVVSAS
jgi:predicted dehydrogenase